MRASRTIAAGIGAAALACSAALVHAPAVSADEARCIAYVQAQGFVPDQVNPSSYSIAESACEAGSRGGWIICTSLMRLATEDFNEAHPPGVDAWTACHLASW